MVFVFSPKLPLLRHGPAQMCAPLAHIPNRVTFESWRALQYPDERARDPEHHPLCSHPQLPSPGHHPMLVRPASATLRAFGQDYARVGET